jgi:hypothetical protein
VGNAGCISQPHWLPFHASEFPRERQGVVQLIVRKKQQHRALNLSGLHKPSIRNFIVTSLGTCSSSIRVTLRALTARWNGKATGFGVRDVCTWEVEKVGYFNGRGTIHLVDDHLGTQTKSLSCCILHCIVSIYKMAVEEEKSRGDVSHIDAEQAQDSTTADPYGSSPWKAIVANPKIVAVCLYANIGALMYGFDNLVLSLALTLPPFS